MTATYPLITRAASDSSPITFSWPDQAATITATRSISGAAAEPVAGAISYLYTTAGKHFFSLAYNVADRPLSVGSVLYELTDGTTTRLLPLSVEPDCTDADADTEPPEVAPLLDSDALGEAMAGPASMTVDGNTFAAHNLKDQIAADKYRRGLIEAEKPLSKRIRIGRFVPPGTT